VRVEKPSLVDPEVLDVSQRERAEDWQLVELAADG
jgi:hypothetical protein